MRTVAHLLNAVMTLLAAVLLEGCHDGGVGRPMWKSVHYRTALADFRTATMLPNEVGEEPGNRKWEKLRE